MSPCQKPLLVRLKLSSSYFWSEMPVCLIGNRLSSSSCSFLLGVQNQSFAALIDFCTWLPSPRIQLTPDSARNPKKSSTKYQTRVETPIEKYNSRRQKDQPEYSTQRERERERENPATPESAGNPENNPTKHQTLVETLQIEERNSRGKKMCQNIPQTHREEWQILV